MKELSSSPDRNTFQRDNYINRMQEEGKEPSPAYLKMWEDAQLQAEKQAVDPEWQKNNLEYDLRTNQEILNKVRQSGVYAQNLYAAMCNMQWIKDGQPWSCSWRYSGGIVADMRQEGDYIDWYCSGIGYPERVSAEEWIKFTPEQEQWFHDSLDYVGEGYVTKEIAEDLLNMGWTPKEWEENESSY